MSLPVDSKKVLSAPYCRPDHFHVSPQNSLSHLPIVAEGWMEKLGGHAFTAYRKRYFVLTSDKELRYYTRDVCKNPHLVNKTEKGVILLSKVHRVRASSTLRRKWGISLETPTRTFLFSTSNSSLQIGWLSIFSDIVRESQVEGKKRAHKLLYRRRQESLSKSKQHQRKSHSKTRSRNRSLIDFNTSHADLTLRKRGFTYTPRSPRRKPTKRRVATDPLLRISRVERVRRSMSHIDKTITRERARTRSRLASFPETDKFYPPEHKSEHETNGIKVLDDVPEFAPTFIGPPEPRPHKKEDEEVRKDSDGLEDEKMNSNGSEFFEELESSEEEIEVVDSPPPIGVTTSLNDDTFKFLKHKPGLTKWRVEAPFRICEYVDPSQILSRGDVYVFLHTSCTDLTQLDLIDRLATGLKPSLETEWKYSIHYWVGSQSSVDKAAIAAIKILELKQILDTDASIIREEEGQETEKFHSFFGDLGYRDGGTVSSLRKAISHRQLFKAALYRVRHIKGRSVVYTLAEQISINRHLISTKQVHVMNLWRCIYVIRSHDCNLWELSEAARLAQNLLNHRANKPAGLSIKHYFFDEFANFLKVGVDSRSSILHTIDTRNGLYPLIMQFAMSGDEYAEDHKHSDMEFLEISENQKHETIVSATTTSDKEFLPYNINSSKCYILSTSIDYSRPINSTISKFSLPCPQHGYTYTWMGCKTSKNVRRETKKFLRLIDFPAKRQSLMFEGYEDPIIPFRFSNWPLYIHIEYKPPKYVREQNINPIDLYNSFPETEDTPFEHVSSEEVFVYHVDGTKWDKLTNDDFGIFSSTCGYVCHHLTVADTDGIADSPANSEEVCNIYYWVGKNCPFVSFAAQMFDMEKKIQHSVQEMTGLLPKTEMIRQHREPDEFLAMFSQHLIVFDGTRNALENDIKIPQRSLFRISGNTALRIRADEVDCSITSFVSGSTFVLVTKTLLFLWRGYYADAAQYSLALKVSSLFEETRLLVEVDEGDEPSEFWSELCDSEIPELEQRCSIPYLEKPKPQVSRNHFSHNTFLVPKKRIKLKLVDGKPRYYAYIPPHNDSLIWTSEPKFFLCKKSTYGSFRVEPQRHWNQDLLLPTVSAILDAGSHIFIWFGELANKQLRSKTNKLASKCAIHVPQDNKRSANCIISVEESGEECKLFCSLFIVWKTRPLEQGLVFSPINAHMKN